jgi:hypothetical protein
MGARPTNNEMLAHGSDLLAGSSHTDTFRSGRVGFPWIRPESFQRSRRRSAVAI